MIYAFSFWQIDLDVKFFKIVLCIEHVSINYVCDQYSLKRDNVQTTEQILIYVIDEQNNLRITFPFDKHD